MSEFRKLVRQMQKELQKQEKLLALLAAERAAIVKLNQDQIDTLLVEKEKLLDDAREIEGERQRLVEKIAETAKTKPPLKLGQIVELCPEHTVGLELRRVGEELKNIATEVNELNSYNGVLIKQTLGLVASTISIFRAAPETDLPTYGKSGKLNRDSEDPAFTSKRPQNVRKTV